MKTAFLAVALLSSQFAYASGSSSVVIAVGYNAQAPAARMQVLADYVAVPVIVQNDSKDPVKRGDEIEKALRAMAEKLAQHPDLKVMPGVVSLSNREKSKSYGSSEPDAGSSARLYVLGSLKQETSIFAVTKRIYQVVAAVPLAEGTRIVLGNTTLGVDDPEKYRNQLLGLMAKSVGDAKKSLSSTGAVDIDGLENPVTVMQLNDREVLLYINYRLRLQARTT
jgi:hypothetical protein